MKRRPGILKKNNSCRESCFNKSNKFSKGGNRRNIRRNISIDRHAMLLEEIFFFKNMLPAIFW